MAVQISGNDITVPRDTTVTRNLTVGGVLTYEDVTNVDSVGLVTARSGIEIGARPGVAASISVDGNMIISGISTFGDDITFTGATSGRDVVFDTSLNQIRAQDNAKLCAGSSSDLEIYHNGSTSYIDNYTGALYLRNNVSSDVNGDIYIQAKSGENSVACYDDGAVELYHDNVKRFETDSNGVRVVAPEGARAELRIIGDEGDDNNDYFKLSAGEGTLKLQDASNGSSWEDNIVINAAGSVELYYDNSKKFETNTNGNQVTGQLVVPDGGNNTGNNNITFGSDNDCHVYHNGTDFYMVNTTGKLDLRAKAGEKSIVANPDGAVELYHDNTLQCSTAANGLAFPAGKGIDFSATANSDQTGSSMSSELLDDYEEGSWTPGNSDMGITNHYAYYTKVGRMVHIVMDITFASSPADSSQVGYVTQLPFDAGNFAQHVTVQWFGTSSVNNNNYYNTWMQTYVASGDDKLSILDARYGTYVTRATLAGKKLRANFWYVAS